MKSINILIVEDEVISTHYLLDILETLGFSNIYDVTNMKDAVEIIKKNHIDLVFMDINIQGSVDGITCAKIINEHYSLPIIFTTAYGDSATILEASDTNIFGYLIKPFESNEVEAILLIALKRIEESVCQKQYMDTTKNDTVDLGMGQKYNLTKRTFYINNNAINLTKNELNVLSILCKNVNQNISYDTLKQNAWNNKDIAYSTIRDTVSRMKKKTPNLDIENIVNFGYILKR